MDPERPRNIYSEPQLYDALHWWKINDLEFIAEWARRCGGPVLELAAGTGRLAPPILSQGLSYTGIESSPEYARAARVKLAPYGRRARIIQADMRSFRLPGRFEFIFIGFNAFMHLETDTGARACLRRVRRHLSATGMFLIDMLVPDPEFLYRPRHRSYELVRFPHPEGGECTVKEKNNYDPETGIDHVDWFLYREDRDKPDHYAFDMRIYYPDTMDRLLSEAGLVIREKLGDRDGRRLSEDSELQIYLCGK